MPTPGEGSDSGVVGGGSLGVDFDADSAGAFDLLRRDGAGAVLQDRLARNVDHGGFDAEMGRAGIEDGFDAANEVVEDVVGGRGAGVAEAIGAGRGDGDAGGAEELKCGGMSGDANADEGAAGGYGVRDGGSFGQKHGERAGPEGAGELLDALAELGGNGGYAVEIVEAGDVDDERVPGGPLLGGEDAGHGFCGECVGAEAVDGFGGEGDEAAGAEEICGPRYIGGITGT